MPSTENRLPSATRQIARGAAVVIVAYLITTPIRLLATILTAQTFGTGAASEAFFASNRFSEIIFNLVAGGALGSAFIPTFTSLLTRKKQADAWRLASAITNLIFIILFLLSLLSMIFAQQVVHYLLAPGFSVTDPTKEALTAELLRIQMPTALIFALSGLLMGILNAHQHFLLPALAPAMYNVGRIIGILFFAPHLGIYGLAWGVLLGAGMHLLLQVPLLFKLPRRSYIPTFGLNFPPLREVLVLMLPRLLGVAVVQLNFLLNTYLASLQPEGSVAAISLAFPLMLMPQAAIAQSIATAALPTFSAQFALNKLNEMRSSLASTLRGVLLLSIPTTLGLVLLRHPLIAMLYQRDQFTQQSTSLVAWALLWYAAGLVGHCVVEMISRAFYAMHDTKTPVLVGIGAMSLNLLFSLLFSSIFQSIGWMPHGGLALANSLATAIEGVVLLWLMHKRLKGLEDQRMLAVTLKSLIATIAMGAVIWLWQSYAIGFSAWQVTLIGVLLGSMVYALSISLLQVEEIKAVWQFVCHRTHELIIKE
jgi:putative peptidoglycan lipid II flippase